MFLTKFKPRGITIRTVSVLDYTKQITVQGTKIVLDHYFLMLHGGFKKKTQFQSNLQACFQNVRVCSKKMKW